MSLATQWQPTVSHPHGATALYIAVARLPWVRLAAVAMRLTGGCQNSAPAAATDISSAIVPRLYFKPAREACGNFWRVGCYRAHFTPGRRTAARGAPVATGQGWSDLPPVRNQILQPRASKQPRGATLLGHGTNRHAAEFNIINWLDAPGDLTGLRYRPENLKQIRPRGRQYSTAPVDQRFSFFRVGRGGVWGVWGNRSRLHLLAALPRLHISSARLALALRRSAAPSHVRCKGTAQPD